MNVQRNMFNACLSKDQALLANIYWCEIESKMSKMKNKMKSIESNSKSYIDVMWFSVGAYNVQIDLQET